MATLKSFLEKKSRRAPHKAVNMECIVEAVEAAGTAADGSVKVRRLSSAVDASDLSERTKRRRCTFECIAGTTAQDGCTSDAETPAHALQQARPFADIIADQPRAIGIEMPVENARVPAQDAPSVAERKLRVTSFSTAEAVIPYSLVNVTRFLPRSFKLVSQLYKILESTYKFNARRSLSLVLVKYAGSIERLFQRRLEHAYLEQISYIAGDAIEFKPIRILDSGEMVDSFVVSILRSVDIDQLLYAHFMRSYQDWLAKEQIETNSRTLHKGFCAEDVVLPRKSLFPELLNDAAAQATLQTNPSAMDAKKAKQAATSIYERIKEKEQQRREAFLGQRVVSVDYREKIDNIFMVGRRRAIKLSDLLFQLDSGPGSKAAASKFIREHCTIKLIDQVEYVLRQTQGKED
ncbi:hypothetical protein PAPHI01_1739 [Pancytospora philotis]|nr:hypothetical protein PAPHI01_1739 [Pancytospora philotis]